MEEISKIVIVNLLYLGDLLFSTPFIRNLRKNYPEAQLDIVVNAKFRDIIKNNPHLDGVYAFDKRWGLKKSCEFAKALRVENYDLGLNIHGSYRSLILTRLINPGYSMGFCQPGGSFFLDRRVLKEGEHMVEVYLNFLKNLGVQIKAGQELELIIEEKAQERMDSLLTAHRAGQEDILIGLNTGGTWPTKRWTKEGFAGLARLLLDQGLKIIFLGGAEDLERVQDILDMVECKGSIIEATASTDLMELAALINRCSLVISGDTGPVHVAAALGVPTVTIFGPSDDKKYRPYGPGHEIVKLDLDCQPCGKHNCDHHTCMKEIRAEDVYRSVQSRISALTKEVF